MSSGFRRWQKPEYMLIVLAGAMALSFTPWMALLNNFVIEEAAFTGKEIGILQSIREIPGFLAFAAVFLLFLWKEQTVAYISLLLLGVGVAVTGMFPSVLGLYITTVVMSIGFHYYETMQQSLTLQLVDKDRAPLVMGQQISARAIASVVAYAAIFIFSWQLNASYEVMFAMAGVGTLVIILLAWFYFPKFQGPVTQHRKMILRKRYWLYYALTFLSGARRQIFIVFAGFMMVEKFGFEVKHVVALLFVNHVINIYLAPRIGRLIAHWGERRALTFEYVGLICVFVAYAFVESAVVAAMLYIIDHLFFAFAIGIRSYFQKIADPADMAGSAGVAFSINHVAAVVIPALFGLIWLFSPALVFLAGAVLAAMSLALARVVPEVPVPGNEALIGPRFPVAGHSPAE